MATDIVSSLFGVTPESYQRQQEAAAQAQALRFAELDPMQRATYGIYSGASQLGGAIGRALGGEDPELARISMRQQIAKQIDPSNEESILSGIRALQSTDPQGAMMLTQELRRLQESGALVRQREAAALASEAAAKRERQQAIPADILKGQEIARLEAQREALSVPGMPDETGVTARQIASLDRQIAGLRDLKVVGDALVDTAGNVIYKAPSKEAKEPSFGAEAERLSREMYQTGYGQLTPTQMAAVNKRVEAAKPKGPTIVMPPQEKEEQGARGKLLVKQYETVSDSARIASRTLPALESNLSILDEGFKTGFGTETKAAAAKVLSGLGVANADKYATDSQTFLANASSAILQRQLEQKGPQTEADAQRITQTGAQLGNTPAANRFLLSVAKAQLKRDIDQRSFYDKWWKTNKTYDGAEDAWLSGEGGKSLFERPELKSYGVKTSAAEQIPGQRAPAAAPGGMPPGFRRVP